MDEHTIFESKHWVFGLIYIVYDWWKSGCRWTGLLAIYVYIELKYTVKSVLYTPVYLHTMAKRKSTKEVLYSDQIMIYFC
jgi:hypothetical protein